MVGEFSDFGSANATVDVVAGVVVVGSGLYYASVVGWQQYFAQRRVDDAPRQPSATGVRFERLEHAIGGGVGDYGHTEWVCADQLWFYATVDFGGDCLRAVECFGLAMAAEWLNLVLTPYNPVRESDASALIGARSVRANTWMAMTVRFICG